MSSACQCHVDGAFCFYCEVYTPVVAENERLKAEFSAEENRRCEIEVLADSIALENETLRKELAWYADYDNNYDPALIDVYGYLPIDQDGGKRAREALRIPEVSADEPTQESAS